MMPLLTLALATIQTGAKPITLKLGRQNEIEGWLVAKEPKTGYTAEGGEWRFAYASPKDGLDLIRVLGGEKTYAMVATTLVSDKPRKVALLFGSDDGGTLSLNGKPLWTKTIVRGVKRDEERVELDLQKGENALVFRVDQGTGGWGLLARLENGEGVTSRVAIQPRIGDSSPERFIRDAAQSSAVPLDADLAMRTAATIDRATFWNKRVGKDPKLDREMEVVVYMEPNPNAAYALIESQVRAAYEKARAPFVAKAQNPGPLFPQIKGEPGIRVMPGGRQFQFANGKPYIPIGYNHNPDWTDFWNAWPLHPEKYDPKIADARFAKLAANGVNLVRMMAETPPSSNLEDSVGTFSPEHMTLLDNLVTSARRHGVRIMFTPYDTFWMNLRADASPYWTMNGGPVDPARKAEWYTAPALREAHKRRNRWLIDRYGNLDTIFVWEPMNEADIWWDASPEQIGAWASDVVADARTYQRKRWGVDRLFSISSAHPVPGGTLGDLIFRRTDLDLANTHLYIGASRRPPKDASEVVAAEAEGIRHALREIKDDRPYIDTENGPIDGWIADPKLDAAVFHDQSWSHLASGGAGSGLRWPYRNPHHLTDGMLAHLKRMRTFADAVDWSKLTGKATPLEWANATETRTGGTGAANQNADAAVTNRTLAGGQLVATGYATPKGAILFIARTATSNLAKQVALPMPTGVPELVPGQKLGLWRASRLFDTERGVWLPEGALTLPPNVRSVCAVWDR